MTDYPRLNHSVWLEARTDDEYLVGRLLGVMQAAAWSANYLGGQDLLLYERVPLDPAAYRARMGKVLEMIIGQTSAQRQAQYRALVDEIEGRIVEWPAGPMSTERRNAVVSGAEMQRIALSPWRTEDAKRGYEEALQAAKDAAVKLMDVGLSEAEAARVVGLNRMTVRKAQGKI